MELDQGETLLSILLVAELEGVESVDLNLVAGGGFELQRRIDSA